MLSASVIILLTLVCSLVFVTITIGFGRMIGWIEDDLGIKQPSQEQEQYMRQVRVRNAADMYWEAVGTRTGKRHHVARKSMSTLSSMKAASTDMGEQ
jgi:hypothetical protein